MITLEHLMDLFILIHKLSFDRTVCLKIKIFYYLKKIKEARFCYAIQPQYSFQIHLNYYHRLKDLVRVTPEKYDLYLIF